MLMADRLRALRQQKKLSQGDIEKRSVLLRCYISRVENGHTVPAVETLEKLARAMDVPLYQLFYDIDAPPEICNVREPGAVDKLVGAVRRKKLACSASSAHSSVERERRIASCCFGWLSEWPARAGDEPRMPQPTCRDRI